MELEGAVVVVTGASRGIGRAAALAFARAGADVACVARTTDASPARLPGTVEETARAVEALGRRALAVSCDVREEAQVESLAERVAAAFGRVDVLVNNAAVNRRAPFVETPAKVWDLVLGVNLRGTALCTKVFLPGMIGRGSGSIVNVSSGVTVDAEATARLGVIPYAVSKAGVEALTGALALELAPSGVAVNCLRIEVAVATEGARAVSPTGDFEWTQPDEVARGMVWLASREASFSGRIVTLADARAAMGGGEG